MFVCMVAGVVVTVLAAFGVVDVLVKFVPNSLQRAIVAGIGLLCALVGMEQVGMVVRSDESLVGAGNFSQEPAVWLTLLGLVLLTLLNERKVTGSILAVMAILTLLDWSLVDGWPALKLSQPQLPPLQPFDFAAMGQPCFWPQVASMVLLLIFDGMACLLGIGRQAERVDENGTVEGGRGALVAIGLGTLVSGICGASPMVISGASSAA